MDVLRAFVLASAACALAALGTSSAARSGSDIVDVTHFGAVADDGKDDTAAVKAAIAECARRSPATLVFPRGRYDFFPETDFKTAGHVPALFAVSNAKCLTIDGRGSTLMFHGITSVFGFGECANTVVKDLTIDWERPPFSIGSVEASEGNHFDVRVFDEYPVEGGEPVGAFMDYDPRTRLPARHGMDEYNTAVSTELVRPQVLRVNLRHQARIQPGMLAVLRHQVYGNNALSFWRCTDTRVENVTVHTAPGMGLVGNQCTNIEIDRFRVVPRPGSGRLMSTTADAVHLSGTRGSITITNSEFDGMGDDAANIKSGLYLIVREIVDDRTVIGQHNLKIPDAPDPGDTMEMAHQSDMLVFAEAVVKSVENLPDNKHRIEFTEDLPDELKVGDVIGNASRVARTRVSDCVVRNNRARGFLIQQRDAIVESCRFHNVTSGGVWVITETVHFYESIGSRDVIVRNNVFDNCNYGGPLGESVLGVFGILEGWKRAPKPGIHKRILIEGNTIRGADNAAIYVSGTEGITIRGNTVEGVCDRPTHDIGRSAIYVMSSRDVKVEGNTVCADKQGAAFEAALTLGPGCDRETVRVKDNTGDFAF